MATQAARGAGDGTNTGLIAGIVAVATIGGLLFGYDSGAVNGTQDGLRAAFHLSDASLGFTVGSLLIGCFVGAFGAGTLAERLGRRQVMRAASVLFLGGALVQGFAQAHWLFVASRMAGGVAVGAASVLSPAYIAEIAPAHIRGRMTTMQQIMVIAGLTAAALVNYLLQQLAGGSTRHMLAGGLEAWRWMFLAQAVPAAVFLVALCFVPESPRFLVARGRHDDAGGVLARLFGATVAAAKLEEIRASFAGGHRPRLADVLAPGTGLRPIVWAGLVLAVFQQLVGINVIFYYGATLWQAAGFSEAQALQTNIVNSAISVVACLVTVGVVDRVGRKPLLLVGSAGMAVALFAMVWAFSTGTLSGGRLVLPGHMGGIAVAAALAYSALFNTSWGPVMWVMLGEMFPTRLRGSALAVCGFAQWFANYLVTQTFPVMLGSVGLAASYSFYGACAVASFFLVARFVGETKGRELEDMRG